MDEHPKPFLTPNDIAQKLFVTTRAVVRWIVQGKLRANRVGGRWRIQQADLDEFLRNPPDSKPGRKPKPKE
ncbi:MAG: hypothetical protein Fur005_24630 [Roseiflexaceae bacterium]